MVSWSGRPFLRLVVVGVVASAIATALDAVVLDGGGTLRSGLPQAVLAITPFLVSPLWRRTADGLRAARDRTGLIAVVVLGLVAVGYGVVRVGNGVSGGQRVLSGVVVVLGVACILLVVRLLTWASSQEAVETAAVDD